MAMASSGPFLVFEELKVQKRKKNKRRRGKEWIYENGQWLRLHPDVPPEQAGRETIPSDDPGELAKQIRRSKVAQRLLAFLETAVLSPAFSADHLALTIHRLVMQRCTLSKEDLGALKDLPVLTTVAIRGKELLDASRPQDMNAGLIAKALQGLAVYKDDMPQLRGLIEPFAAHARQVVEDMDAKEVSFVIWAVSELRECVPGLQDEVLPLFAEPKRLQSARVFLQRWSPQDYGAMRTALLKLQKEVPYLRQVLASWY